MELQLALDALAITAFIIAVWQTYLAIKQLVEAKQQTNTIIAIQGSLSTKSIGEFPSYMSDLICLIQQANKSVTIACDYVGYGLFSQREKFLQYSHAVQDQINAGKEVKYLLLSKDKRSQLHDAQFEEHQRDEHSWQRWRNDNQPRLAIFCRFYAKGIEPTNISPEIFKAALEEAEIELLNGVFRGAVLKEIDFQSSVYFWIRDNTEVIFTIPSFSEEAKEFAFRSVDEQLIKSFLGIHDRYGKMAKEYRKEEPA